MSGTVPRQNCRGWACGPRKLMKISPECDRIPPARNGEIVDPVVNSSFACSWPKWRPPVRCGAPVPRQNVAQWLGVIPATCTGVGGGIVRQQRRAHDGEGVVPRTSTTLGASVASRISRRSWRCASVRPASHDVTWTGQADSRDIHRNLWVRQNAIARARQLILSPVTRQVVDLGQGVAGT